jgi:tetratricopeptide (TPR) repeat protein
MDSDLLYRLMDDTSLLNQDTLAPLEEELRRHPYFQAVRMLWLKNLALLHDLRFGAELKRTSIYVPDRKKLFMFIEDIRLSIADNPRQAPEEKKDAFALIDEFLGEHSHALGDAEHDPGLLLPPTAGSNYFDWRRLAQADEQLPDKEAGEEQGKDTPPPLKGGDLIDRFLEADKARGSAARLSLSDEEEDEGVPDMPPIKTGDYSPSDNSYFTETLARVYIKQKKYERALTILRNLIKEYPEKNIYFADQIRFLEKLIINAKKV